MTKEVFDASWLALREPVDHRSRTGRLVPLLTGVWRQASWSRVLDLGSGTGSNLRYLGPRLPDGQEWTLVDHDPGLLEHATTPAGVSGLRRVSGDLATEGLDLVKDADLVTGSALLDLVSEAWLRALAEACQRSACGALFALSYDGTIEWTGTGAEDGPADELVRSAVNAHQRRDKGLGPALGPTAGPVAQIAFQNVGYRTWCLPSPWQLDQRDSALIRALVEGWERAALAESPAEGDRIREWANHRRQRVATGEFALTVGHVDLLALPRASRP